MSIIPRLDGQLKQWKKLSLKDMLPIGIELPPILCAECAYPHCEHTCPLTREVKSWNIEHTENGFIMHNPPWWFYSYNHQGSGVLQYSA